MNNVARKIEKRKYLLTGYIDSPIGVANFSPIHVILEKCSFWLFSVSRFYKRKDSSLGKRTSVNKRFVGRNRIFPNNQSTNTYS